MNISKTLLFILLLIYVVSPVDLMAGPIDDLIMIALYLANNKDKIEI